MSESLRIAVVTPIPTPYRDRFWNVVAEQKGVSLDVFFCAKGKPDRPWDVTWPQEFNAVYPAARNLLSWRGPTASCYWNAEVGSTIRKGNYDAVLVGGYNHVTMLSAVRAARSAGSPWYLMCESNMSAKRGAVKSAVKDFALKRWLKTAKGGLPTGTLASAYLRHYGFADERLFQLPNVPDVDSLRDRSLELAPLRMPFRETMGLRPDSTVLLFVGRFIQSKGVLELMAAFGRVANGRDLELVMVGDGPLRDDLEQLKQQSKYTDRIHFPGFVAPEDIVKWFCAADVMVHPSRETWGVVILEAIASGLPVLVSDRTGCARDVILDDTVGRVLENTHEEALAESIADWVDTSAPRELAAIHGQWQAGFDKFGHKSLAGRLVEMLTANAPARKVAVA